MTPADRLERAFAEHALHAPDDACDFCLLKRKLDSALTEIARIKKTREHDDAYVQSLRDASEREKQSADHRALVIGDLAAKLRSASARIERADAIWEVAIRCGFQLGQCDHGEGCQDPMCELRDLLSKTTMPPEQS
jgi:hypothetical protein